MAGQQRINPVPNVQDRIALPIWCDAEFSAEAWLKYFEHNRENRSTLRFADAVSFSDELRVPLIRSLQRFQIGETGEGKHLRHFAARVGDPVYERCIDMFIKEEQLHARILAEVIGALDGTLLSWHWSDLAFIALRRMLGLKTEIFILLIAEIVGKCFYLQCARAVPNQRIATAFSLIVVDEIAHLEFHTEFLEQRLRRVPEMARLAIFWAWSALFYAAVLVFVADHKRALLALNMTPREFVQECSKAFNRAGSKALSIL